MYARSNTGTAGVQWRMPKREPKEKVACQEDPALPKEGRPLLKSAHFMRILGLDIFPFCLD